MSYRDFQYPEVRQALGLNLSERDLHGSCVPVTLDPGFVERMRSGIDLGLTVSTEKARSEFIIAPILLEVRRMSGDRFGLFSGVEFNVDASRGLAGSVVQPSDEINTAQVVEPQISQAAKVVNRDTRQHGRPPFH